MDGANDAISENSLVLAFALLLTSHVDKPPAYHPLLAFIGFGVAVIWIYLIANEIVSLLKTFGIVFGLSDAILGLTVRIGNRKCSKYAHCSLSFFSQVLAWGNSIGDLIADVAISKQVTTSKILSLQFAN